MKKSIIFVLSLLFILPSLRAENIGVPSECEDVMLQTFYWNSHQLTKYGRTKWVDLMKDTAAINANFDLVWFPPSAVSSGGVGYYHTCLSNQDNTAWGQKATLLSLIDALHKGGTRVIADIVVNHRYNKSSWCDFYPDNFGTYGTFQLTSAHICADDEGFTNSSSSCYGSSNHGAPDSGTNDGGCRDLDHTNPYVQNWVKAYLNWMLNVMHYDAFRYDMTRGYDGQFLSMYNQAANPYMSVSEFWMDNVNDQINHLQAAEYNTMIFDFPLKRKLHDAINGNAYGQLKNPSNSLRGKGYAKYAVTFVDNHDTFERSDNQGGEFYQYNADLSTLLVQGRILQANAYILMMPGIPCVFWPHWYSYRDEINALIAVRKRAGIHSESQVLDESGQGNKYEATIVGHRGTVILRLGTGRSKTVPDGYELALEGGMYNPYTIFIKMNAENIDNTTDERRSSRKFIENGQLYIRHGEKIYDVMGNQIR